jgi:hypothetical protein
VTQHQVTFYAYGFDGAPTLSTHGWFEVPHGRHLFTPRARSALARATGSRVTIHRCAGWFDESAVHCEDSVELFIGDAAPRLWWFTQFCARSVLARWDAPDAVRAFLSGTEPSLRSEAHRCAWAAQRELTGVARLAAQVAMYAASAENVVLAARGACRVVNQIAADQLPAAVARQERALGSAMLAVVPRPLARGTESEITRT